MAAILGAGALAAPGFYLPFDVVIVNDEIVSPSRIEYTIALFWGMLFLAIGYALGNRRKWWRHDGSPTA